MKEVTPVELKKMKDSNEDFQLIDVREEYEAEKANEDLNPDGKFAVAGGNVSNGGRLGWAKRLVENADFVELVECCACVRQPEKPETRSNGTGKVAR